VTPLKTDPMCFKTDLMLLAWPEGKCFCIAIKASSESGSNNASIWPITDWKICISSLSLLAQTSCKIVSYNASSLAKEEVVDELNSFRNHCSGVESFPFP